MQTTALPRRHRILAAAGALLACASIALAAYASHAVDGTAQVRGSSAAMIGFGQGIALAALAPMARGRLAFAALCAQLAGTLLFSGSLAGAIVLGTSTALAPFGGSLLMAGWLVHAVAMLRG